MKQATINDVAEQCGVSIKTVSRVLNREPTVSAATKVRVQEAIQLLKYRPNSPARMLAGSRTYVIGLIYNASSSYITSIQNGALEVCRDGNYDVLIHPCVYTNPNLLEEISDLVTVPKVDGLLLTPPISDVPSVRKLLRDLNVPNVIISRESVHDSDWTVCTNDRKVCAEMVQHLSQLGHQRIAFIQAHPDHKAMANRFEGYKDGMTQAGLEVHESMLLQGSNTFESGVECALQLLNSKQRPTAIFCANDHMAAGVMTVAHEMKLSIPQDLSVAGFDDIPLASQIWPQLTTVRQPLHHMARLAGQLLIQRLHKESPDEVNRVTNAEIIIRDSTGPAPKTF